MLLTFGLSSCQKAFDQIAIGQTKDSILEIVDEYRIMFDNNLLICSTSEANHVIKFGDNGKALTINSTNKTIFCEANIDYIHNGYTLFETIEILGFPRFYGTSYNYSLDFGYPDQNVHRLFFALNNEGDLSMNDYIELDYNDPDTWCDNDKDKLPSLQLTTKVKIGMSLDEVIRIMGKPQRDIGSGTVIFEFDLDNGSVFTTFWHIERDDSMSGMPSGFTLFKSEISK